MKKSIFAVAAATMVLGFNSCTNVPKAELVTEVDSLSYALGVVQCDPRLKDALEMQFQLDSTNYDAFVKGFLKATNTTDNDAIAEALGFQIGLQYNEKALKQNSAYFFSGDTTKLLNADALINAWVSAFKGEKTLMTLDSARLFVNEFQQALYEQNMEKQYADWKKRNEDFLAENGKKNGVVTTESGLQYKVTRLGKGKIATDDTQLYVTYTGTLVDSTQFDSSIKEDRKTKVKKNTPFAVKPNGSVIEGWKEILKTVPVGTKLTLYVPYDLGYGARTMGKIKPFSTLIFDMEISDRK